MFRYKTALMCAMSAILLAAAGRVLAVQEPTFYAIEFVAAAATGIAMNDNGDVVGTWYKDTGCGSTCLPPLKTVVWRRDGLRTVLRRLPGLSPITVTGINDSGWISGFAGYDYSNAHAVVWKPGTSGYQPIDLGILPDTTKSTAVGLDNAGRVVGYSNTRFFPPTGAPFVWEDPTGMIDLTTLGAPNDSPLAISSSGVIATSGYWYSLDAPAVADMIEPPPVGFLGPGGFPTAINDSGDQVRFLASTGSGFHPYLFRYSSDGTWMRIWPLPASSLKPYGVGSINNDGDITATVTGVGLIAYGPDGSAQALANKLSPAYGGGSVTVGGPINNAGEILSRVIIGASPRLVRLVPAEPCMASCVRVNSIQMQGQASGGQCVATAYNKVNATVTVTDELGRALRGVRVSGRFLDDYWTDKRMSRRTDRNGTASFSYQGPACVGTVAFLIDNATKTGRVLDRTTGTLAASVIPR